MSSQKAISAVSDMISLMDNETLNQLSGGYDSDIDNLIDDMVKETDRLFNTGQANNTASAIGLEHIGATYEETLRREDMSYFVSSVFEGDYIKMNWHHVEWGRIANTYKKIMLKASRGHGKTWWWTNLYSLWRMYRHDDRIPKYNHREIRHFTQTTDLGEGMLREMKNMVMETPILKERLWSDKNYAWKKEEVSTKNGCFWKTEGFWSATRGVHPQTIIVDDPFKEDVAFSPTKRLKSLEIFFATIIPMLEPEGQMVMVGTPMHEEDLYGNITNNSDKREMFACFEYPAIDEEGRMLWEDRWSYDLLMEQKNTQGSLTFAREYMMQVVSSASSLFPYEILRNSTDGMNKYKLSTNKEAFPKQFTRYLMGCDNAKSANVGSDYTVYTVYGVDDDGSFWLLFVHREKGMSFNSQIHKLKSMNAAWRPDVIVVEANNFQSIYSEVLQDTSLPIIPHTTGTDKKSLEHGLPTLAVLHERGKIKYPNGDAFSKNMVEVFHSEHNSIIYTKKGKLEAASGHDDCTMSEWLAVVVGGNYVLHGGGATSFGFLDM